MQEDDSNGGYGKPPKRGRFSKGYSGNPRGRPKGSKNLATLIAEAAYDKITVTAKNGERRKLSRIQATMLQWSTKAAQGDPKAMATFVGLVDGMEKRANAARPPEMPMGEKDLAVLYEVHKRMQECSLVDQKPQALE